MVTPIEQWSWIEAVETVESQITFDLTDLSEDEKIKYINLLKEKLNKIRMKET
tara:strand:- start:101 stop:259 length:159 start_codon:yes stop_codon:yes gene_type:complete